MEKKNKTLGTERCVNIEILYIKIKKNIIIIIIFIIIIIIIIIVIVIIIIVVVGLVSNVGF